MDARPVSCPLCCGKTFDSKQELIKHLSDYPKFRCSICKAEFLSIPVLIEHLKKTYCSPKQVFQPLGSQSIQNVGIQVFAQSNLNGLSQADNIVIQKDDYENNSLEEDHEISELQGSSFELLQNDFSKPFSGSSMQLLENNGHSNYTISEDSVPSSLSESVITKQNSDGTISITSLKDEKVPVITMAENNLSTAEVPEETYSCNSCGISFTSVLEHIQNYHKDHDVIVEVNESFSGTENQDEVPVNVKNENGAEDFNESNNVVTETVSLKRVITDAGFIVETEENNAKEEYITADASKLEEVVDKKGQVFTRRLVQVEDISKVVNKSQYHQVVSKEIMTVDSGQKMKVYNCISCHIYVKDINDFKSHPCKSLKYSCPTCDASYSSTKSLGAHMKAHKNNLTQTPSKNSNNKTSEEVKAGLLTEVYCCDICNTSFPSNKSLKLHRRMHDPIKSRPIDPPVSESPGEDTDRYHCAQCDKWIPVSYRKIHLECHSDNFNCLICNKKFTSNNYLMMHMAVHNTEKAPVKLTDKSISNPYKCMYCNRQFARPHEKVKHERIHTGEKPHSCEICGKSFRVSYCLTLHMRTHTGARPYTCQQCGKRFKAHSVYNHHLMTHSDVRAFKCPFCPKAFKTSVQLAGHKNSHTKPFSCNICNRPFASLYAARVHTESHRRRNNMKFSCAQCGASYARSFALRDHLKQAHGESGDDVFQVHVINDEESKKWLAAAQETEEITEDMNTSDMQEITILDVNDAETVIA